MQWRTYKGALPAHALPYWKFQSLRLLHVMSPSRRPMEGQNHKVSNALWENPGSATAYLCKWVLH